MASSKSSGVDLGGTFLETFKTLPGGSLSEQVETFKKFMEAVSPSSSTSPSSVSREALPKPGQDWEKLLSEAANAVEPPASSPAADPMTGLLGALIQAAKPVAASGLLKPTGLALTPLMELLTKAENFGFVERNGTPPRFTVTGDGMAAFQQSQSQAR
jgi:hypothetical protein